MLSQEQYDKAKKNDGEIYLVPDEDNYITQEELDKDLNILQDKINSNINLSTEQLKTIISTTYETKSDAKTTYETKSDANQKLNETKDYTDSKLSEFADDFIEALLLILKTIYGEDIDIDNFTIDELFSIREISNEEANKIKDELLNGAGEAYDTLKELGELINENVNAIEALEAVATNKQDKINSPSDIGAVPTSRTINNKALSSNITLTPNDIGAATALDVKNQFTDTLNNNYVLMMEKIISDGVWTVPSNIVNNSVRVCLFGAGGGGGGGDDWSTMSSNYDQYSGGAGGGGGGGHLTIETISVQPGEQFTITIGKGGAGGINGTVGYDRSSNKYVRDIQPTQGEKGGTTTITSKITNISLNAAGGDGGGAASWQTAGRGGNGGTGGGAGGPGGKDHYDYGVYMSYGANGGSGSYGGGGGATGCSRIGRYDYDYTLYSGGQGGVYGGGGGSCVLVEDASTLTDQRSLGGEYGGKGGINTDYPAIAGKTIPILSDKELMFFNITDEKRDITSSAGSSYSFNNSTSNYSYFGGIGGGGGGYGSKGGSAKDHNGGAGGGFYSDGVDATKKIISSYTSDTKYSYQRSYASASGGSGFGPYGIGMPGTFLYEYTNTQDSIYNCPEGKNAQGGGGGGGVGFSSSEIYARGGRGGDATGASKKVEASNGLNGLVVIFYYIKPEFIV